MKIKLIIIAFLLAFTCQSYGQAISGIENDSLLARNKALRSFTKNIFLSDQDTLPYRLLYPENYSKNKSYPIVVFLAGTVNEEMTMKNNYMQFHKL